MFSSNISRVQDMYLRVTSLSNQSFDNLQQKVLRKIYLIASQDVTLRHSRLSMFLERSAGVLYSYGESLMKIRSL